MNESLNPCSLHCPHLGELWAWYQKESGGHQAKLVNQPCTQCQEWQKRITNQNEDHKKEVNTLRLKLNDLEDFKKRMGTTVSAAMTSKSHPSENIDDPCRKTKLLTMYNDIETQIWGKAKDQIGHLNQDDHKRKAKTLIKKTFQKAKEELEKLTKTQTPDCPPEIKAYMESSIHSLQLVYYWNYKIYMDTGHVNFPAEMEAIHNSKLFRELYIHCFFISRLLALHNPPIEVDLEHTTNEKPFPILVDNPSKFCTPLPQHHPSTTTNAPTDQSQHMCHPN
ncbi:uncharacterized protein LOC134077837 [Sardina pilchardus]|uniref:uncharacterized protein LOC134077837 n=1 Tax=Sardina pilchardus TaxID=27697 RepID=UPI002E0E5DCC